MFSRNKHFFLKNSNDEVNIYNQCKKNYYTSSDYEECSFVFGFYYFTIKPKEKPAMREFSTETAARSIVLT